jgi:hypothetical protein
MGCSSSDGNEGWRLARMIENVFVKISTGARRDGN